MGIIMVGKELNHHLISQITEREHPLSNCHPDLRVWFGRWAKKPGIKERHKIVIGFIKKRYLVCKN